MQRERHWRAVSELHDSTRHPTHSPSPSTMMHWIVSMKKAPVPLGKGKAESETSLIANVSSCSTSLSLKKLVVWKDLIPGMCCMESLDRRKSLLRSVPADNKWTIDYSIYLLSFGL